MALFEYTHVNQTGQEAQGLVDAASLEEARRRLRTAGYHVIEIAQRQAEAQRKAVSDRRRVRRIGTRELSTATRQLSVLMQAGMPLVNALSTLVEQSGDNRLGRVFAQVRDSVNEGVTLGRALADHPSVFPGTYVNMVEASEAAGTLEEVLAQLADLYERRAKLTGKVKAALAYPLFMLVVGFSVVVFVLSFVLPSITKLFLEMKMRLPWPTIVLIRTSDVISRYFWVLAVLLVGLLVAFVYWTRTSAGRKLWDRFSVAVLSHSRCLAQQRSDYCRSADACRTCGGQYRHCPGCRRRQRQGQSRRHHREFSAQQRRLSARGSQHDRRRRTKRDRRGRTGKIGRSA